MSTFGDLDIPYAAPGVCHRCRRPMADHDRDAIDAGLVQYSCPEPESP